MNIKAISMLNSGPWMFCLWAFLNAILKYHTDVF